MPNHPIFAPTFHGDLERVTALLDEDPELVEVRDAKGLTPLHVAASRGQDDIIRLLIDRGADIEGPTEDGEWSPLAFAAYRGHLGAVEALIECGAEVGEAAGNPIHFAGQRKHKEVCRLLVQGGAVDDLVDPAEPDLLELFRASFSYDLESVEQILDSRPELVHGKDRNGRTPLHEVSTHGDVKAAKVLLQAGADPGVLDDRGQSPIDRAAAHRQHAVSRLFEKHGRAGSD